ncbi:hypothetical protein A0G02_05860 [Pectobacterium peruviense]|nr:hypothetical protein A0G02_05860 [Pectobacterium peruviense]
MLIVTCHGYSTIFLLLNHQVYWSGGRRIYFFAIMLTLTLTLTLTAWLPASWIIRRTRQRRVMKVQTTVSVQL